MKTVEEISKELDEITKESFEKAHELSDILKKYNDIDLELGEELSEDDKNNQRGFLASVDARRQGVLRRLLIEWGGLLFI